MRPQSPALAHLVVMPGADEALVAVQVFYVADALPVSATCEHNTHTSSATGPQMLLWIVLRVPFKLKSTAGRAQRRAGCKCPLAGFKIDWGAFSPCISPHPLTSGPPAWKQTLSIPKRFPLKRKIVT